MGSEFYQITSSLSDVRKNTENSNLGGAAYEGRTVDWRLCRVVKVVGTLSLAGKGNSARGGARIESRIIAFSLIGPSSSAVVTGNLR